MNLEDLKAILKKREKEKVEFKEWRSNFSISGDEKIERRRECLLGYCVGIGNVGGGYLIAGVNNAGKIVGTSAHIGKKIYKQIFDKTQQKITIDEIMDEDGKRVIVFEIPARRRGELLRFGGVPLTRIGDALEIMTEAEEERIILEGREDFSARVCEASSMSDLDIEAISKIRKLYEEKNAQNRGLKTLSDRQFLSDLGLMRTEKLTYAGVILLAKKEFLDLHLMNAEIWFEYRNRANDIKHNDRVEYRGPFVLLADKIREKILSRQQVYPIIEGFLRREIPAFNEEVFREALFNAVCHRDYTSPGSVEIKQSPEFIEINSPGGFPLGVTPDNITFAPSTPRNRLLAEAFQKIFPGVERSGQGADKIFRFTIEEGKGLPDYTQSTTHNVKLIIPAMLKDENFVKYLGKISNERQTLFSTDEIMLLEKIREGKQNGINLKMVKSLLNQGIIELHGKTRGRKYVLSRRFYSEFGNLGDRTRNINLDRNKKKELILKHLQDYGGGKMEEFKQIFPETEPGYIANLLQELKKSGKIERHGKKTTGAVWRIK